MDETVSDDVRALLEERRGYVLYGKADRVAAVDEQLALRGYRQAAQERAKAAPARPQGRRARQDETA